MDYTSIFSGAEVDERLNSTLVMTQLPEEFLTYFSGRNIPESERAAFESWVTETLTKAQFTGHSLCYVEITQGDVKARTMFSLSIRNDHGNNIRTINFAQYPIVADTNGLSYSIITFTGALDGVGDMTIGSKRVQISADA